MIIGIRADGDVDQRTRARKRARGRPAAVAFSVGLHLAGVLGVFVAAQAGAFEYPRLREPRVTFVMMSETVPLPTVGLDPPAIESPETTPVSAARPLVTAVAAPRPSAPIVPPGEKEMERPVPAPVEPLVPVAELPPAFGPVIVGRAARGGDGAAEVVGAFDRREARGSGTGASSFAAATAAGFDGAAPVRVRRAQPAHPVEPGGFDRLPAVRPVPTGVEAMPPPIDTPAEVVFKPVPEYTTEARALRIEGDVVLEVEFAASNEVRVLRVVHGLGHGLDEAAVEAARRIQFKPAERLGQAVNCRATVHIVFRLS